MVFVKNNQLFKPIDEQKITHRVEEFLAKLNLENWDVSVVFVDSTESAKLNQQYRHKTGAANVLSFPCLTLSPGQTPEPEDDGIQDLGDIIICPEKVDADALAWQVEFSINLERMIAHGLLHLLGYDHTTDAQHETMTELEEGLVGRKFEA
jgi:probable rRNA maturation factor